MTRASMFWIVAELELQQDVVNETRRRSRSAFKAKGLAEKENMRARRVSSAQGGEQKGKTDFKDGSETWKRPRKRISKRNVYDETHTPPASVSE